jgi:hypothetical protein
MKVHQIFERGCINTKIQRVLIRRIASMNRFYPITDFEGTNFLCFIVDYSCRELPFAEVLISALKFSLLI